MSPPVIGVRSATVVDGAGTERAIHDLGRHRRRSLTRRELAAAWVTDRLPLCLRGRFAVGGRELGLIALVAALGLCAAAALALRSSAASAAPVTRAPALASTTTGPSHAPSGGPLVAPVGSAARKQVVVDVAGAVVHPRVVTLPAGSRVFEALKAAGGAKRGVDVSTLNLARVVVDGEQILVGRSSPASAPASGGGGTSVVSLNRATESELDALPGVGPVTAKSIVAWRQQHGSFTKVDELQEIDGIGPKTFAKLKPLVSL
ncbi:MAG: ComEA family DNA-binding protein [Marmoricola sp.]